MSEAGTSNEGEAEERGAEGSEGDRSVAMDEPAGAASGREAYVLDASALLCLMNDEPGADRVAAALSRAVISAVTLAEVAAKLNELGADADEARALLAPLHLSVVPLDEGTAFAAGALRAATHGHGLSVGDRACLALCAAQGATALTTNKAWAGLKETVSVAVEVLR